MNKIASVVGIVSVIIVSIAVASCGKNDNNNNVIKDGMVGDVNSRVQTEYVVSSTPNFGSNITDMEYVVLNYTYNSKKLEDKYGSKFEVSDLGGTADNQHFMFAFLDIFKGTGSYHVTIDNDVWVIEISKKYFGEWIVESCELEDN